MDYISYLLDSATITGVVSSENFGDGLYIYANGITIRHQFVQ